MKKFFLIIFLCISLLFSKAQENKPVMGWNSYNCFGAAVREDEVKANADFIATNLIQFGWQYVVVDYCWFYPHTPKSIQGNPPNFACLMTAVMFPVP